MLPEKPSFSGSLPIRAPLTLDDSEFDSSSNGTFIHSGPESEGFVSGDDLEVASTEPLVLDPDADLTGNVWEEDDGSVKVDTSLRVTPLAKLSGYDDDEVEEVVAYEVEGNENFSVVRAPSIDMSENFVGLPRIKAWDVDAEELETLIWRDSSGVNQSFITNGMAFANHINSDGFIEQLSIDMSEHFVGLPRTKTSDVEGERLETSMLRKSSTVKHSFISNELTAANCKSSVNFIEHGTFDMTENFVGWPKIKVLNNGEEEEMETLALRDSSAANQSFNAKDLAFVDHLNFDNFIEDENVVESFGTDNRLVDKQTLGRVLEDKVVQEEYLTAIDTDIILQDPRTSVNTEQLSKVKIASDGLDDEGGINLGNLDRLEGDTVEMVETGVVGMKSMAERMLEVDTKETTGMLEGTLVGIGESSLLKSSIEDPKQSKLLKMIAPSCDLQKQNIKTQVDLNQPVGLALDAFVKSFGCTGSESIFCLPTQEAAASDSQRVNLDIECENVKLTTMNKNIIYSTYKLNEASYRSSEDDARKGKNIPIDESTKFSDPRLLQQNVYVENDLEDDLFNSCHSCEHVERGLNLEERVKKEQIVDFDAISQESTRAGSTPNGDAEGLISAGHEHFMEQISALSILLGSEGSSYKNSQQEQEDRASHEKLNLLKDEKHLLCTINDGNLNHNRIAITSVDESSAFFVKDPASLSFLPAFEGQIGFKHNVSDKEKGKVKKIQAISVKFLRMVQRLNLSLKDPFVLKVLCRLVADIGRHSTQESVIESAKILAKKLEEKCDDDLDFSLNILILGRSGVGKSATINSIFGETKVMTSAFEPATTSVKEVTGTVQGIKIRVLDTPGLRSPMKEQAFNRKLLASIKRYMKRFPLDVILYVDRVDSQTWDFNDLPLLKSITSSFDASIWQRAILTLTHAASIPWDDPTGFPLSYEAFVAQKSNLVQQLISRAAGDMCQENPSFVCPVSLVENHPLCGNNEDGECLLASGLEWRGRLLASCISLKILCEVSSMAGPQTLLDQWKHLFFQNQSHSSSRSHPLSSLMQSRAQLVFSTNRS